LYLFSAHRIFDEEKSIILVKLMIEWILLQLHWHRFYLIKM
jgi:hypothetical protein